MNKKCDGFRQNEHIEHFSKFKTSILKLNRLGNLFDLD